MAADRLMALRGELASSKPDNALDALVMLVSMQAITSAITRTELDELGEPALRMGIAELSRALNGLRAFLESEAGVTADALGLNPDGRRWQ